MLSLVHAITLSYGWRRNVIAFCAGIAGALALAPIHFFPAAVIPLAVSVWLLDGLQPANQRHSFLFDTSALKQAALIGWCLGFGYFVASLWWLGAAFLVEAEEFAWALPFGVAGLPAILACFTAAGFVLARLLWSDGSARILALAIGLGVTEWLRGTLFTGFPWNTFGMALGGNIVLAQVASLVGLHGLTFLAVFIFASPAVLSSRSSAGRSSSAFVVACALFVAITLFGSLRLWTAPDEYHPALRIRIMQPNTPQDDKFRPENKEQILANYLALSARKSALAPNGLSDITHIIWPESPFPFVLSRDPEALMRIAQSLGRSVLITGAARAETIGSSYPGEIRKVSYFNSIQVLTPSGMIVDTYDKVHLVPFGEYLPLSGLLERLGLRQFVHIPGGFEPGVTRKLLQVPGLPQAFPLVCYEAIFPESLPTDLRESAGLIVNVTNDGWFGPTFGPYQHLAQARLRSIESGLPFLRAANTGISAIIDAYGRTIDQLALGTEGVLDTRLPLAITPPVAARFPFLAPFSVALLGLLLLLGLRWRR
jgi:apolipoprotein N-acyltransferase